jgi:ABC-type branched-subunit amino acid transport system ATPase component
MALLKAKGIRVRFGGLLALADVSFSLLPGEIVGLMRSYLLELPELSKRFVFSII